MVLFAAATFAQATIYPAKKQEKTIAITGATIHVGNGKVIEKGTIVFSAGKIVSVREGVNVPQDNVFLINAAGKHIYPGFIAPVNNLGLAEFESVRATRDFQETGIINPHVRALIAYNTDSKVIPTVRANGVLLTQATPEGGVVSGTSSIMALDGWNWEDAAYKKDIGIHFNWPSSQTGSRRFSTVTPEQQKENYQRQLSELEGYFAQAKAYAEDAKSVVFNARFSAMAGLFNDSKRAFVNVDKQKDIIVAVKFFKKFGITPVIVGATEAYEIVSFLKENNINIIMRESQALPDNVDDDVYLPYKNAKILQDAGLLIAMSVDGYWQQRNLPWMAGVAAAYGLTKEQALATITSNTAKILGIDKTTGTLEEGKDANLFISDGDALDMLGNNVTAAFIMGKTIVLDDLHKQLYKRYADKYGIKAD